MSSEWACALKQVQMGGFDRVQTEDVFREANEHIAEKARKLALQQPIPFLCECSDKRCFAHLFLDPAEYEEARSDPRRYLPIAGPEGVRAAVVPSHERFALTQTLYKV